MFNRGDVGLVIKERLLYGASLNGASLNQAKKQLTKVIFWGSLGTYFCWPMISWCSSLVLKIIHIYNNALSWTFKLLQNYDCHSSFTMTSSYRLTCQSLRLTPTPLYWSQIPLKPSGTITMWKMTSVTYNMTSHVPEETIWYDLPWTKIKWITGE